MLRNTIQALKLIRIVTELIRLRKFQHLDVDRKGNITITMWDGRSHNETLVTRTVDDTVRWLKVYQLQERKEFEWLAKRYGRYLV